VIVLVIAVAIGIGVWQDREGGPVAPDEVGLIDQVVPNVPDAEALSTAPEAGALAPNFRLETVGGEVVELADLRGTPIFLNFWATWCFFCLTEMPAMQNIADEYGDQVIVMGVNAGDSPEDARLYAANNDIHYTLALDTDLDITEAYEVRQMPTSVFIDEHGVITSVIYGVLVPDQMRQNINAMLEADTAATDGDANMADFTVAAQFRRSAARR
jgi:thiol-disulfide isomerase/thioredoxin